MQDREYFSHPFVNNSTLSKWRGNQYLNQKILDFGTLVHACILQFHRIDLINCTIDGTPVLPDDMKRAMNMRRAFFKNDFCANFHAQCNKEVEMYSPNTQFEYAGKKFAIDTKCKYDFWHAIGRYGGDFKSTSAQTYGQFLNDIDVYDYDRGRVFYAAGSGAEKDVIIGQSKHGTHEIFIVFMHKGGYLWERGQAKLNELAFDYWKNNIPI